MTAHKERGVGLLFSGSGKFIEYELRIDNKDKEDPIVDIFNIVPQVRDTGTH